MSISEESIVRAEKALERKKSYYHSFVSRAQSLANQLTALSQKKVLVSSTDQARCPLCDQPADKASLCSTLEAEEKHYTHQRTRLTAIITTLKAVLIKEHESLQELKAARDREKLMVVKKEELEKQKIKLAAERVELSNTATTHQDLIFSLHTQKEELLKEQQALKQAQEQSQTDETITALQKELTLSEQTLEAVPYRPEQEKAIHERLTALSALATKQSILVKELALQEQRRQRVHETCNNARALKAQITLLTSTVQELSGYKHEEAALLSHEQQIQQKAQELVKLKEQLIHQKGVLEAQQSALKKREEDYQLEKQRLAACTQEVDDYTAIACALSKDGIQALLIEDTLPEIEQEANNLLSRLTNNQAHLSIESLRDLKSGRTKETLDIKISDAVGVRPYELFSGGEAFRIDFALRIAISKLLARRAGTALQTLIIDEGFGSQDEEGLANIMECLYTIAQDFEKIIIVSHLASMKEQFPVHFLVTKQSQGSQVQVIEHC